MQGLDLLRFNKLWRHMRDLARKNMPFFAVVRLKNIRRWWNYSSKLGYDETNMLGTCRFDQKLRQRPEATCQTLADCIIISPISGDASWEYTPKLASAESFRTWWLKKGIWGTITMVIYPLISETALPSTSWSTLCFAFIERILFAENLCFHLVVQTRLLDLCWDHFHYPKLKHRTI